MVEVALMDPSKTTDNKLRWQAVVEGVNFKLYVPKWRVPRPWPTPILGRISDGPAGAQVRDQAATAASSNSLESPICGIVERVLEHTQNVRFAPQSEPRDWGMGWPYSPF